ncbi:MAG: hypothetical protein JOZ19_12845 [Rubrobacter sp.]|nr:hypothetical protein [Rubrobacter sp.]
MKGKTVLPEVTLLYDARGARPEKAAGIGEFWYELEVWELPLSPTVRVFYTALCSFLAHGQINRQDLRGTLKDRTDEEIVNALQDLVRHNLLAPTDRFINSSDTLRGYEVRSVRDFES